MVVPHTPGTGEPKPTFKPSKPSGSISTLRQNRPMALRRLRQNSFGLLLGVLLSLFLWLLVAATVFTLIGRFTKP